MASSHTREAVVIEANFLREDLPYFTELLAEVVSLTKYTSQSTNYQDFIYDDANMLQPTSSTRRLSESCT